MSRQNIYPAGAYGPGLATLNGPALYRNLVSSTDSQLEPDGRVYNVQQKVGPALASTPYFFPNGVANGVPSTTLDVPMPNGREMSIISIVTGNAAVTSVSGQIVLLLNGQIVFDGVNPANISLLGAVQPLPLRATLQISFDTLRLVNLDTTNYLIFVIMVATGNAHILQLQS